MKAFNVHVVCSNIYIYISVPIVVCLCTGFACVCAHACVDRQSCAEGVRPYPCRASCLVPLLRLRKPETYTVRDSSPSLNFPFILEEIILRRSGVSNAGHVVTTRVRVRTNASGLSTCCFTLFFGSKNELLKWIIQLALLHRVVNKIAENVDVLKRSTHTSQHLIYIFLNVESSNQAVVV